MEHWQHDTFIVRWRDRGLNADAFLTFSLDPDGKIVHALMVPISPRTDFSFDFQDLRLAPVDKRSSRSYRNAVIRSAGPGRKSVVKGKSVSGSVDYGGGRTLKKKKN